MRKSLLLKVFAIALIAAMLVPSLAAAQTPFDWQQEKGKTISLIMVKHAYTDSVVPLFPEFEKLTGINPAICLHKTLPRHTDRADHLTVRTLQKWVLPPVPPDPPSTNQ